jgi:hypothetical protein
VPATAFIDLPAPTTTFPYKPLLLLPRAKSHVL